MRTRAVRDPFDQGRPEVAARALGDVVDIIVYDTVDPVVLEFELLPVPGSVPAP